MGDVAKKRGRERGEGSMRMREGIKKWNDGEWVHECVNDCVRGLVC